MTNRRTNQSLYFCEKMVKCQGTCMLKMGLVCVKINSNQTINSQSGEHFQGPIFINEFKAKQCTQCSLNCRT
jgi:hypothetical protein